MPFLPEGRKGCAVFICDFELTPPPKSVQQSRHLILTVAPDTYQGLKNVHIKFSKRHESDVQHSKRNAQCGPRNGRQCQMCGWEDLRFCAQVVTHPRRETITLRISHCGNMKGTGKSCNFAASFFHE